ncbi:MAG: RagB/SusD family nutrient uptake outer membrane protein [Gemmatimonadetes bacterium]|nr:RagB/SusD family nutrient uptake outer membrane protein [Gemmatimonadota bacterium]
MKRSRGAAGLYALLLVSPATIAVQGCTDLSEQPFDVVTPDNFYRNEAEIIGGRAAVYSQLRPSLWGYFNLSEISTDEMIVPTRGGDWYDNGRWLEIQYQTWAPGSASMTDDANGTWNDMFTGVARANVLLAALPGVTIANKDMVEAEARGVRAFFYYILQDMFGGVPIVTDTEIKPRPRNTRAEVFKFIEEELKFARDRLPASWPASQHGRLTKGAANAMLANLYVNAGVFTKDQGINPTGYNSCQGVQVGGGQNACQAALDAANAVLNSGQYTLEADYHSNFTANNQSSRENIFVIKASNEPGAGLNSNFLYRSTHYAQGFGGGWNGFSTLAETYFAFDTLAIDKQVVRRLTIDRVPFTDTLNLLRSRDTRHEIFLDGLAQNLQTGKPITYRNSDVPLYFSPHFPHGETRASEADGVRIYKYKGDPNYVGTEHGNDYAYFRLAEIYLVKAEALAALGRTGEALEAINTVRARAFEPDRPLTSAANIQSAILRERHMELTAELKRRQDLIRFGRFTQPWSFKKSQPAKVLLFPIPQTQLDANPLLTQNAGY